MIIGYARVSGKDQNLDRQIASLKEYGCEKIFADKATGKNFNRPEFNTMMEVLRAGDTLVVHEFDRLGRNKKLTLKVLQDLKNKGVRLVALNLPTTQMQTDDNLMLETINNIVIELYTMMAQQEIETREKRQREGIDQALDKGVKFGRTAIDYPDEWETIYNMVKNKEITSVRAMGMLGLKKTTYFKLKKQYEEQIKNK
ncbi:recombinase family protein [Romboutsia sp. 1001216sp1]|nr:MULTISPECIES: recombinase family protein [unclassified Romboutsia]MDB8794902.1 recombinase family protein [Romboutsia sp. 1001216sp1]MDB8800554.1 recombinase family protein [Romboutsia sp. 1001216sp1]